MPKKRPIRLRTHEGEEGAAYLELLAYPTDGSPPDIAKTIDIHSMIEDYCGPRLALDLDKDGRPLGMEILYSLEEIPNDDDEEDGDDGALEGPNSPSFP